jgi:hypothetical protein
LSYTKTTNPRVEGILLKEGHVMYGAVRERLTAYGGDVEHSNTQTRKISSTEAFGGHLVTVDSFCYGKIEFVDLRVQS